MTSSTGGKHTMAKKQRTIQLPEEVFAFAEAYEEQTGVRFNRQLLAALLQYHLSYLDRPDPLWMRLAVCMERGDLTLPDVVTHIAQDQIHELDTAFLIDKEQAEAQGRDYSGTAYTHKKNTAAFQCWVDLVDKAKKRGEDPLAAVIEAYKGSHNRTFTRPNAATD